MPVTEGVHDVLEALGVQGPPPREIQRLESIAFRAWGVEGLGGLGFRGLGFRS